MGPDEAGPALIAIELAHSPAARVVEQIALSLPAGSTLADAVRAAGLGDRLADSGAVFGVWGRRCPAETVLRDGDRVECYRPLQVDPMVSRRRRQAQHREQLAARQKLRAGGRSRG